MRAGGPIALGASEPAVNRAGSRAAGDRRIRRRPDTLHPRVQAHSARASSAESTRTCRSASDAGSCSRRVRITSHAGWPTSSAITRLRPNCGSSKPPTARRQVGRPCLQSPRPFGPDTTSTADSCGVATGCRLEAGQAADVVTAGYSASRQKLSGRRRARRSPCGAARSSPGRPASGGASTETPGRRRTAGRKARR